MKKSEDEEVKLKFKQSLEEYLKPETKEDQMPEIQIEKVDEVDEVEDNTEMKESECLEES